MCNVGGLAYLVCIWCWGFVLLFTLLLSVSELVFGIVVDIYTVGVNVGVGVGVIKCYFC